MGQILPWQQENGNLHDPYAVAVVKAGAIVGLVPQAVVTRFFRRMKWELELSPAGGIILKAT